MRRSWTTIVLIGGLAVLLVVLGILQYRWLSQISVADGEKAHKLVKEQAERFAADFNREIQNAYFNFQTGPETFKNEDWRSFAEQYDYWHERATYPELIAEMYFVKAANDAAVLRYDREGRTFVPAEVTRELSAALSRIADDKNFHPIDEASLTLFLPVHEMGRKVDRVLVRTSQPRVARQPMPINFPETYGHLVIKLNPATVKERLLPDLAEKYFGDGEYRTAVKGSGGEAVFHGISGETADAAAPLFVLSPENFIFFSNKDLLSSIEREKHQNLKLSSHFESRSMTRTETRNENNSTVKIEVKGDTEPRMAAFTATTGGPGAGPWTLQVQHASGSLDAYLANTLRRNLTLGFGILVLLAAAIAAIIISAMRSKMLAQRQIDFVSSVSHEFRTPIAVIYSAGENLADGVAADKVQVERYGVLIKGEGRKLSSMVEQILEFAGARSGRRRFNFAETDVANVIDSALKECRPLIEETKFLVETDISSTLPTVNADRTALSQAIQNLIANAVKYSNGNSWLRIVAANGDGKVRISVEDRGIGISKSDMRQIFEPFYRSTEVVDAQINGNGLGLALVKQIVEAHGGTRSATSERGKGSTFTIELPQSYLTQRRKDCKDAKKSMLRVN